MDPLATIDDLDMRGIAVVGDVDVSTVLGAVSDAVRDAAGHSITQLTSTVVFVATDYCTLDLPAGPVSAVSSVKVNGVEVAGWSKIGDTVYLPSGWTTSLPVEVTVTYTHGYPVIPADIVDLVCSVAGIAMNSGDDYGNSAQLQSFRQGQLSETYFHTAGLDSPSPVALPESVRQQLRARFGGSVVTLAQR